MFIIVTITVLIKLYNYDENHGNDDKGDYDVTMMMTDIIITNPCCHPHIY